MKATQRGVNLWTSEGGMMWSRINVTGPMVAWRQDELQILPNGVAHMQMVFSWPPMVGQFDSIAARIAEWLS